MVEAIDLGSIKCGFESHPAYLFITMNTDNKDKQEIGSSLKSLILARRLLFRKNGYFMPWSSYEDKSSVSYNPPSYDDYMILNSIEASIKKLFFLALDFPKLEPVDRYTFQMSVNNFIFLKEYANEDLEYNPENLQEGYWFLNSPDCDPRIRMMFDYFINEVTGPLGLNRVSDKDLNSSTYKLYRHINSWVVLMFYCYLSGLDPDKAVEDMMAYNDGALYIFDSELCAKKCWSKVKADTSK